MARSFIPCSFRIQDLAEEDRPREKLLSKGIDSLTNAELLAVIIGSGTKDASAVVLAQQILRTNDNSLQVLAKRSVRELERFKGIGQAKAIALVCAMELTRRRYQEHKAKVKSLCSSSQVYRFMKPDLTDKLIEEFCVLLLNNANRLIKKLKISTGGTSVTIVDPKVLFRRALEYSATSMILIHNHPSGNPTPSQADIQLTKRILSAGKLFDIDILDHIIFADQVYFSFADEGLLKL